MKAVAKPKFDFKGTTAKQSTFQATAEVLEYTGVAAYLGQVGNIASKKILGAAGSILPIEAYHAAWIADIRRHGAAPRPAPAAFAKAKTKAAGARSRQGDRLHRRLIDGDRALGVGPWLVRPTPSALQI